MKVPSPAPRILAWSIFVAASIFVGFFIPGFYEWTDSNQSRPSPLLWKVPLGSAVAAFAFTLLLPWLPIRRSQEPKPEEPGPEASRSQDPGSNSGAERRPLRYGVKTLMLITAGVALTAALLINAPWVAGSIALGGSVIQTIRCAVKRPIHRPALVGLVGCMILPYAWLVEYDELDRMLPELLIMLPAMPTFLPAAILGGFLGQHAQESVWIALLLTALELAVGLWVIRLGPKRTIAYLLGVIHLSAFGSLVFYQLCIA